MASAGKWAFGVAMASLAIAGLVLASRSDEDGPYLAGLMLFLLGILVVFRLIGRHSGTPQKPH